MRNDDLQLRALREPLCPHPGILQHGFVSYASLLDGPLGVVSTEQNLLQSRKKLYSDGCRYMRYDDFNSSDDCGVRGYLTYCEVELLLLHSSLFTLLSSLFSQLCWQA
jgi:hypothetical protein